MEYEAHLVPVDKAVVTPLGFFEPLCNTCSSPDCSNPIQEREVSNAGIIKKQRLWVERGSMVRQVVSCKGYIGDAPATMGPLSS